MTGNDVAAIITAIGVLITAFTGLGNLMLSRSISKKSDKLAADVEVIHHATNSLTERLVEKADQAGRAEGTAVGLEQGRNENPPTRQDEPVKVEIVKIPPPRGVAP